MPIKLFEAAAKDCPHGFLEGIAASAELKGMGQKVGASQMCLPSSFRGEAKRRARDRETPATGYEFRSQPVRLSRE